MRTCQVGELRVRRDPLVFADPIPCVGRQPAPHAIPAIAHSNGDFRLIDAVQNLQCTCCYCEPNRPWHRIGAACGHALCMLRGARGGVCRIVSKRAEQSGNEEKQKLWRSEAQGFEVTCCSLRCSVDTSAPSFMTIMASSVPRAAKSQHVAAQSNTLAISSNGASKWPARCSLQCVFPQWYAACVTRTVSRPSTLRRGLPRLHTMPCAYAGSEPVLR